VTPNEKVLALAFCAVAFGIAVAAVLYRRIG
jgi:hypothetical protein